MSIEITVPVLPESVANASVATWHKKPGDTVSRDERLVDIETDKVILEVVAPEDGILEKIVKNTGATVVAKEVIGALKPQVEKSSTPLSAPSASLKSSASEPEGSPAERRRIMADSAPNKKPAHPMMGRVEQRVPMSRLRARIAQRLLAAQHEAAILTTFNEVNMQPIMDLRARYKDAFEKAHGVKLGFMSFFTIAVIAALKKFPAINARIEGSDIVYNEYYDIAIAVSTPRGLVVPVLRDAQYLSMAQIEQHINELGEKAREGRLTLEEMTGGTFTISNGGVFGSLLSTPILNVPQSGILGMHKIEERPVVEKGQIVIRPMMYLALSYDHRIIDGRESVQFLVAIKALLEDPASWLLNI